jgi:Raf kinase inhibitor-like YbhB/YbcL family protein
MKLSSPAFEDNAPMGESFTCRGDGHNPPLHISEVPGDAASLALIMDDPDAPGGEFVHWIAWNINRDTTLIDEGLPPPNAIEGQNSLGRVGYVAPCPPSGTHHYHFKLYAVDKELELNETTTKDELVRAMTGHIIDEAELVGLVSAKSPEKPEEE